MTFYSYDFIFYFLPVAVLGFWIISLLKKDILSKLWIILISLFYYCSFKESNWFFIFFIAVILFNYIIGKSLIILKNKKLRLVLLFLGLIENLSLLFYFKYTNFFITLLNKFKFFNISFRDIMIPLGISFFTFRLISYIVDCYKGKTKRYSLIDYLVFITYFPVLLMGPIFRHNELIPQLNSQNLLNFNKTNFKKGIIFFSLGLGKKVILATPLLEYTNLVFNLENNPTPIGLWLGLLTNFFAFYFDFSGYSDMATGVSHFFNISIKENFNSPYKARNIQDYWKRWHISLTKFLNEYVFSYIYRPGNSIFRFCIATMITFTISGLWHGAGVNYILWGMIHGFSLCIIAVLSLKSTKKYLMPKLPARIITIIILIFSASLYATDGINNYIEVLKILVNINFYKELGKTSAINNIMITLTSNFYYIIILLVSAYISFYKKNTFELTKKQLDKPSLIIFSAMVFIVSLFSLGTTSTFLYQNF